VRAAVIVKFWLFLQKRAFFIYNHPKLVLLMPRGIPRAFAKSPYFMTSQLAGGGGPLSALNTEILNIAAVHATAWRFGTEGLIKINFCIKAHEKSKDTAFDHFKNFKMTSLLREIQHSKHQQKSSKSSKHTSRIWQ
jgi:hypothetical protein